MKKKNTSKYSNDAIDIREFIEKISKTSQLLKEAYVYEDDMDVDAVDGEVVEDAAPVDNGKEYVDAIRKAALQGIQAFEQDVDSASYQFFKKVFMLADKVLSEKEGNEGSDE